MENNVDIMCKKLQVKQCNKLFTKRTQDTTLNLAPIYWSSNMFPLLCIAHLTSALLGDSTEHKSADNNIIEKKQKQVIG